MAPLLPPIYLLLERGHLHHDRLWPAVQALASSSFEKEGVAPAIT